MSNSKEKEYDVNFFKPATKHTRVNMKLVIILVIIWAVAVFGFQFLLIILNQPTPEKSYNQFESVWPGVVENPKIDIKSKQDFSKALLMVLGKNIAVKPGHKKVLKETLSLTVYNSISKKENTAFK